MAGPCRSRRTTAGRTPRGSRSRASSSRSIGATCTSATPELSRERLRDAPRDSPARDDVPEDEREEGSAPADDREVEDLVVSEDPRHEHRPFEELDERAAR